MESDTRVLCAGHVNWDVVLHTEAVPDPDFSSDISNEHAKCGGSATNTALALSSLGYDTAMVGNIGDDEYGSRVTDVLQDAGVEPALVVGDLPTTVIYALITPNADPRYFAKDATLEDFGRDDIDDELWADIGHVHLTTFSEPIATELAQAAADDGKTVSFNPTQGYGDEAFTGVVDAADVVFLNEREAEFFRNRHDFAEIIKDTCVVITNGAAGASAYGPHGVVTHPGFNVSEDEIDDTIGAGDSFVAGFLSEWLAAHETREDYEQALKQANASGAYAVTSVGAPEGLDPDWMTSLRAGD